MVVGARFNPPGSWKGVGAVPRNNRGASGQKAEIQYLSPSERSGHDISLHVEIDAGVPIEAVECPTHRITSERPARTKFAAALAPHDQIPNRDFVLRYRVSGEQINSGMLTHSDERGGFFTLMLYPPADFVSIPRSPMEMVFVLDCSGSMSGRPLAQAKEAIRTALELLTPSDSFQLINFSSSASQLGPHPLEANRQNIRRALRHLTELDAEGGTMMLEGIKAALDFPHDSKRLRFVCFLTDGYIGNEDEILTAIQKKIGPSRIFSFGVGPAVNRFLLDSMARIGRGAVAYLLPETDTPEVMRNFFERISRPAMTDLQIDWAGITASEIFPKTVPDLFPGRPILLTGRYSGNLPANIIISARSGEGRIDFPVPILRENSPNSPLATLWARAKLADLSQRNMRRAESPQNVALIRKTALQYNLLSAYTAFIAVDSTRRTAGFEGTSVPVAIPAPPGVKYETTVRE
jgi:Ca-activated chloride channel family protein